MSCPTTGNRSFPVALGFSPSTEDYNAVRDTNDINFQWASRPNAPNFTNPTVMSLTETGIAISACTYRGLKYKLLQAQICQPTHKGWLGSMVLQQKNTTDFILTFKAEQSSVSLKYIFVVVPLLQEDTYTGDSRFLQGLAGQNVGGSFSFDQILPSSDKTFATYQTCFEPAGMNALAVVFLAGRQVSKTVNDSLRAIAGGTVLSFRGPDDVNIEQANSLTNAQFQTNVRSGSLNAAAFSGKVDSTNPTAAYQCVVLDPERDVLDGKITMDTVTGDVKPLNGILSDRKKVMASYTKRKGIEPGVLEKYIAIFLGIILSILVLWGLGWAALTATGRQTLWTTLPQFVQGIPLNLVLAILFMFIGVLIGVFAK